MMGKKFKTNIDLAKIIEPGDPASGDLRVSANASDAIVLTNSLGISKTVLDTGDIPIPVEMGGTGADTPPDARDNLGLGSVAVEDIVPISLGGTGLSTIGTPAQVLAVDQSGAAVHWCDVPADTPAMIKTKYESNPDTNAYTDDAAASVATIPDKLDKVATYGGDGVISTFFHSEGGGGYILTDSGDGSALSGDITLSNGDIGSEPAISPGSSAQYFRGDKSWQEFDATVRASALTGLSTDTNSPITAYDSTLSAFGKLQAQVSAIAPGMNNPMTAAGDIIVAGSGGTPAALHIGTAGQVLTAAAGTVSWQDGGGGVSADYVKLASATISSSTAYATFTSLFDPATYFCYAVYFSRMIPATDGVKLCMQFRQGTSAWNSSTDNISTNSWTYGTTSSSQETTGAHIYITGLPLANATQAQNTPGVSGHMVITAATGTMCATMSGLASGHSTTGSAATLYQFAGGLIVPHPVDGFRMYFSNGNITSGTVTLFGVKK
jgi:hypothetical protein